VTPNIKVTAAVKAVQSQLKFRGILAPAFPVDGVFGAYGSSTDIAVRSYQQDPARNLLNDGSVGPKTWKPLLAGS
jgi:peptidoglycan hydrolase-like protein with peptidoglycan-binding domain